MKYIKRVILTLVVLMCAFCTSMAKDPRSSYSKHSALPKEKTGFRLYGDFMLSADFADSTGCVKPAFGLFATPGAQITNYFFLGGKVGAMYLLDDFFAFPAAVNLRWTFGRKNILTISQSGGVAYCEGDIYPYVDFYFGGRIPLRKGKCLVCALGYAIYPQYNLQKEGEDLTLKVEKDGYTADAVAKEAPRVRTLSSWVEPQLTIAYPFRFEKKNRIRYRVHKFKPHVETQGECKPKSSKAKEKEKSSAKPYEKIDERKRGGAEKTDVERWNP